MTDLLLDVATRAMIDESISAGEASFAEHGGKPPAEVFERLIANPSHEVLIPPSG